MKSSVQRLCPDRKKNKRATPTPSWSACFVLPGGLCWNAVKQPFVNVEEKIDRFVGRRTKTPDALSTATSNKANAIAWRKAFGGARIPRGVYRFKTHEEADQWLCQMIARPRN